jgi:hypothetical protein
VLQGTFGSRLLRAASAMAKYKPRSAAQIRFRLLRYAIEDDTCEGVLGVLAEGVTTAAARIERAEEQGPDEFAEAVADDEIRIIEGLLGAAFIVCQTQITAVTEAALRCRAHAIRGGLSFPAFGDKNHEVRRLGPRFDARWSKIEVLWALANYFKHHDEWPPRTWTNPRGLARFTVPVISAAGLQESSSGNLRTGAEALGNCG